MPVLLYLATLLIASVALAHGAAAQPGSTCDGAGIQYLKAILPPDYLSIDDPRKTTAAGHREAYLIPSSGLEIEATWSARSASSGRDRWSVSDELARAVETALPRRHPHLTVEKSLDPVPSANAVYEAGGSLRYVKLMSWRPDCVLSISIWSGPGDERHLRDVAASLSILDVLMADKKQFAAVPPEVTENAALVGLLFLPMLFVGFVARRARSVPWVAATLPLSVRVTAAGGIAALLAGRAGAYSAASDSPAPDVLLFLWSVAAVGSLYVLTRRAGNPLQLIRFAALAVAAAGLDLIYAEEAALAASIWRSAGACSLLLAIFAAWAAVGVKRQDPTDR